MTFIEERVLEAYSRVLAAHARVDGMKAENRVRRMSGHSPAYGESAFEHEASTMESLANEMHELAERL